MVQYFLIFFGLFQCLYALDTANTYFIASFLDFNQNDAIDSTLALHMHPTQTSQAKVTIQFFSLNANSIITDTITVKNESDSQHIIATNVAQWVPDPRIIIKSDHPIQCFAQIVNSYSGNGDIYMINSIDMIGSEYVVTLPGANSDYFQIIHVMASLENDADVTVKKFTNGRPSGFEASFKLKGKSGSRQKIIVFEPDATNDHYYINSTAPIFVTAAVTGVDLKQAAHIGIGDPLDNVDYTAYMPTPIKTWNCNTMLNLPYDTRTIFSNFTNQVYVQPSTVSCDKVLPIIIFTDDTQCNGTSNFLDNYIASTYYVDSTKTSHFTAQCDHTNIPTSRLGAINARQKDVVADSAFITYIPDLTQFMTGTVWFLSFGDEAYIEVYMLTGPDNGNLMLDGKPIDMSSLKILGINTCAENSSYGFILQLQSAGPHFFSSTNDYILYSIGRNFKGKKGAYGYIAGYDKSKLSTYWDKETTSSF